MINIKLSEVLFESTLTRKQTTEELVKWDLIDKKPLAYCNIGALACEAGMIKNMADSDAIEVWKYGDIMKEYGVTDESISRDYTSYFKDYELDNILASMSTWSSNKMQEHGIYLVEAIWYMNDYLNYTFEKTAKVLQEWEDSGLIKYDWEKLK